MENINTKIETLEKEYYEIKKQYDEERIIYNKYFENLKDKLIDYLNTLNSVKLNDLGYIDYHSSYIYQQYNFEKNIIDAFRITLYLTDKFKDLTSFTIEIFENKIKINKPCCGYYSKDENKVFALMDYLSADIWENERNIINLLWGDYNKNKEKIEPKDETTRKYYEIQNNLKELIREKEMNDFISLLKSKQYVAFTNMEYREGYRDENNYRIIKDPSNTNSGLNIYCSISGKHSIYKIKNITKKNIIVEQCGYRSYLPLISALLHYQRNAIVLLDNENQNINDKGVSFYERTTPIID